MKWPTLGPFESRQKWMQLEGRLRLIFVEDLKELTSFQDWKIHWPLEYTFHNGQAWEFPQDYKGSAIFWCGTEAISPTRFLKIVPTPDVEVPIAWHAAVEREPLPGWPDETLTIYGSLPASVESLVVECMTIWAERESSFSARCELLQEVWQPGED